MTRDIKVEVTDCKVEGRISVVADDTDNGYGGRDKEFGIRFDDRVSFHANEHADGTFRIHFHTREFSNVSRRTADLIESSP